jgi:uncharacterized membrane protein (DUF4010 family)
MHEEDLIRRLAVALAIGLLVGAERHWRERAEPAGRRTAGVRSFALIGFAGGVLAALAQGLGPTGGALLLAAGLIGLVAVLLPFALREAEAEQRFSATSLIAALATYALGALAVAGEARAAAAGAVGMVAILAARESLHGLLARLTWEELRSAVLLLSMTLVALPLIPDAPVAWLAGTNPRQVWTLAILLAAVSYLGYLAVRLGGTERGPLLAGAAGGLVSSTAVTLSQATAARQGAPAGPLAAGALVAGSVSLVRTAALLLLVAPETGRALLAPLLLGGLAMAGAAAALRRRSPVDDAPTPLGNPFELRAVLRITLLLAGVGALARLAAEWLGPGAVLAVAAVTGLTDVDAIALSVPLLAPERLAPELAAQAVLVAVASNLLAKAAYALVIGGARFGGLVSLGTLAALLAGGGAIWLG